MSKINELIKELCPNGIIFKSVGEICETITDYVAAGSFKDLANNVKYLQEPDYAMLIRTTDIKSKFKGDKFIYINESAFNYLWRVNLDKDSLILPNIGNCGEIYYLTPDDLPYERCALATNAILVRSNQVNMKYLKHIFLTKDFQVQLKKITSPSGQTKFNKTDLKKLVIPIPPLEVQEEIVRILDKFGELEAELEAELEVRKSQYEFFRRKLLFDSSYPKVKMEDICVVNQGLQIPINQRKKEPGDNRYFYITVQFLKNEGENYYIENPSQNVICKKDDILVTRTGSTGKIVYGVEGCFHNNFFKVTPIIDLNKKYLYHILNSDQMYKEMLRIASGGTVPDLPHKKFYNIEVFLPTLEEQNRIVNILDKFEVLVNDITVGLPAEIELRKQQYEYYRNKLLSFEDYV